MNGQHTTRKRGKILRLMCHGDPERCYTLKGEPLPLCARCIAFYPLFLMTAILSTPLFITITFKALTVTVVFLTLVFPLVADGYSQYIGLRSSNNPLRTATGALAGIGCGLAISYLATRLLF